MAQIKKLQNGGVPSSEPKKRIYNGVELTDDDINKVISYIGEWGTQNANYSEDIRKWSELATKTKDNLLQGNIPTFDPTGTSMGDVTPGKTNQNIFGNWSGQNLNRQFSSVLKNALDQITNKSNATTTIPSNSTLDKKFHKFASGLISNKYFAGNWENAQKGISEWDENTRKNRVREALLESINEYKNTYNENSPYFNTIDELNNPNITTERLKEIGYAMGTDVSDLLSGTTGTTNSPDRYQNLKQFGTKVEDPYLKSKGLVAFRDNNGVTKLFNDSDLSEYNGEGGIETNYGTYYGYGMFKDPNKGWYWGNKKSFSGTPVYSIAEKNYSLIRNQIQENLKSKYNSVDFNTESSKVFGTPYFNQYRDNNKFEFLDVSGNFSGLNQNKQGANRLIIPKKTATYDDLGSIDLQNSQAILVLNGKQIPVTIKLNTNDESVAVDNNGIEYSLGAYGDIQMNQMNPWESFKTNISLGIETPKLSQSELQTAVNSVQGFNNIPITKQNFNYFVNQILRRNFKNNLTPEEANHLANTLIYYYNTLGKGQYKDPQDMNKINKIINDLTSNLEIKSNFYKKDGGIIKAQVGASLSALTSKKIQQSQPIKLPTSKKDSHSGRLRDMGNWSKLDTLDAVSTGLDAASLAGGAVGVGAGLASTLVQAVSDSNRSGFLSGEMLKNLGINLGFTALAFIPGASAVKVAKIAKTANRVKNATKFIKETEKAVKVLSKVENLSDDAKKALKAVDMAKKVVADAERGKDITKFINKVTLNPITKTAATAARTGFATVGITNGLSSANDIIQDVNAGGAGSIQLNDIRGLVGGFAGTRAAVGMSKNYLIRKGTEPIKPFEKKTIEIKEDASKWSKTKTKVSDFKQNVSKKSSNYVKNKLTDTWQDRKLKSEEGAGWLTKVGINQAKKAGFTEDGLGRNVNQKLIDVLNNESKLTSKPKLALPEYKPNVVSKPISGKYPVADEPYNPVKAFQESINNLLKVPKNTASTKTSKNTKVKYKKANAQRIKGLKNKGLVDNNGQISMKFKQGGRLIPKFQNSGEIISGQQLPPKNQIIGQEIITIPDEFVQPVVIETPIIYPNKVNTSNSSNLYIPNLTKRNFNFDSSLLRELPKLTNSLWTNKRNAQILSGIKPVLLQNPTEVYKPVITNLANENAVNNQVTSFLRRSSIPMTSDATLQKAGMLEAMSKVNPLLIQAKAENTNMYNQSLANSNESAEKYALERNKIANENRQRIGANEARLANIEAGKNIANNASWGNFFDKANQIFERNQLYKYNLENQQKLQDLQREFEGKLKPFEEEYTKLNDKVNSDAYKLFLRRSGVNWDTDILDNGKTGAQLLKEEQEQKYKLWQDERNKLTPFYQNRMLALNNSNPYLTTIKYKSGGELTAQTRVEVQRLRNKLKEKELDAKYIDKTLDRKQKEVQTILNGLSKETFFLLKTILGK